MISLLHKVQGPLDQYWHLSTDQPGIMKSGEQSQATPLTGFCFWMQPLLMLTTWLTVPNRWSQSNWMHRERTDMSSLWQRLTLESVVCWITSMSFECAFDSKDRNPIVMPSSLALNSIVSVLSMLLLLRGCSSLIRVTQFKSFFITAPGKIDPLSSW